MNGRPFRPQRTCRKRTGPCDVTLDEGRDESGEREGDEAERGGEADVEDPLGDEAAGLRRGRGERQERRPVELLQLDLREDVREEVEDEPRLDAHLLAQQEDVLEGLDVAPVDGEDHLVDGQRGQDRREVLERPEDREASRRRPRLRRRGALPHEAEEPQPPPGVVVDEAGHRAGARRVADEDDRPEVVAAHPDLPRDDAHGEPLDDEEQGVEEREERQERPRDEIETEAVDEDRQEDRPPEDDLPDEERLVLEPRRPPAPVGAREEEEAGPDDDDRPDEDEVDRERIESRQTLREEAGEDLAPHQVRRGEGAERRREVGGVERGGDGPGLLLQHSRPDGSPPGPGPPAGRPPRSAS